MKLNRSAYPRVPLVLGLAFAAAVSWSFAATTTYNPSITFGVGATDNVNYVGTGAGRSDATGMVAVSFPIRRTGGRSELAFSVRADYQKYRDVRSLDHSSQRATLRWSREVSRTLRFGVALNGTRTQEQGDAFAVDETDFFLARRTDREVYGARLSLSQDLRRRRWRWGVEVGASRAKFKEIDGYDPEAGAPPVENQRRSNAIVDLSRNVSRRYAVGVYAAFETIALETSPDEDITRAGFQFDRRIGETSSFGLRVGGFRRTRTDDTASSGSDYRDSGYDVSLRVANGQELGPVFVSFVVGVAPSAGGGVQGTSTNYYGGVQVSGTNRNEVWNWEVGARYAVREPTERDDLRLRTATVAGSVERRFGRSVGTRFTARWTDQQDNDPLRSDGSTASVFLNLVWYPIGHTRLASGRPR